MKKDENQMKLFKCYDCGQQFYVSDEDSEDIVCRNCQSDNVSPVNRKPILMKILAFVAIAAIGFGVALSVMNKKSEGPIIDPPIHDTIPSLSDVLKIAKISYSDFTDNGNYTYSFIAKCEFENKEKTDFKYEYQLMETYDGDIIRTSTDGIFKDLKGTKSGSYFFKVIISDGKDKENTEPKEVTGCIERQEKPTPKPLPITPEVIASFKERLENDIKSQNASMGQNYISSSVKIIYTNLRSEDGDGPTNLQDIEDKLDVGKWKNVKVVDITLNQNKVIVSMTLEIEYP